MAMGVLLQSICTVTVMLWLQILGLSGLVADIVIKGGGGKDYLSGLLSLVIAFLLYIYLREITQLRDKELARKALPSVKYEAATAV